MLFANDIILFNGVRYRFLTTVEDQAWIISLNSASAWPESISRTEIDHLDALKQETSIATNLSVSQARIQKRDNAWAILKPLLDQHGNALFEPSHRKRALQHHAAQYAVSETTLYKFLRRYWQRGQTANALLADYHHSGRTISSTKDENVSITGGRGRKALSRHIYQINQQDIDNIKMALEKKYLSNEVSTIKSAYLWMLQEYYSFTDGNQASFLNPLGEYPSERQFNYQLHANFDYEKRKRSKVGDSDYEQKYRKRLGTILEDCLGVGHIYEIDATIVDVYLVASHDRTRIVGKPTLYLIIDRKSRLIVGYYLGLEHASWMGAYLAMLSIAQDKQALCSKYNVKYDQADWPAHQIFPQQFLADRGEMLSYASNSVIQGLGITVATLPSKRPDWKPLVECGFKLIQHAIRNDTPAYDPPANASRRQGKKYEKDACLTLQELGSIILNAIIYHNRRVIANYPLSLEELAKSIEASPISLWNHGIISRSGALSRYEEATIRFALLPRDEATVTDRGINYKGVFYSCEEVIRKKWFERARTKHFKIQIIFDPRLVDTIYICPSGQDPLVAELSGNSRQLTGLSFSEVSFIQKLSKAIAADIQHSHLQNSLNLKREITPIIQYARKQANMDMEQVRKSGGSTRLNARKAYTKPEREEERRTERQETAQIYLKTMDANPSALVPAAHNKPIAPAEPAQVTNPVSILLRNAHNKMGK